MTRRKFIKTGLIWVPAFVAGRKIIAQPSLNAPTAGAFNPPAAGSGCALFASNTDIVNTINNTANFSFLSQKVACSDSRSVCKVLVYQHATENSGTIYIRIRSANNNGGTLHGTSDTLSNNTTGWRTFNFTTPAAVSADFFITIITSSGAGYATIRSSGTGTKYSDTNYDFFNGTADQNQDMCFECWTQ